MLRNDGIATKDIKIENEYLIDEAINIHSKLDKDTEIVPIFSSKIFPFTFHFDEKNYIVLDVNYIKYIECMYVNIIFLMLHIQIGDKEMVEKLLKNIKSDIYHFMALQTYDDPLISYNFLKLSNELYEPLNLHLAHEDSMLFLRLINMYLLRHEATHQRFHLDDSNDQKEFFLEELFYILTYVRSGKSQYNEELKEAYKDYCEILDNDMLADEIEKIWDDPDGIMFEELFCDHVAFHEVIGLFKEAFDEEIEIKATELLIIFEYINDYFRSVGSISQSIKNRKIAPVSIQSNIRHSISYPLRVSAFAEFRNLSENLDANNDYIFEQLHFFQDIYFEYLQKILFDIRTDKDFIFNLMNTDMSEEDAKIHRDRLLNW